MKLKCLFCLLLIVTIVPLLLFKTGNKANAQTNLSWSPSVRVNDDTGAADQWYPAISVTVDGAGNAFAVWMDKRNSNHFDIYVDYRPAGGTWGSEVQVNDALTVGDEPSIAVDAGGNAYVLWESLGKLWFVFLPAGGGWATEALVREQVTDPDAQAIPYADIAVDPAGNAYATWYDRHNPTPDPYDQDLYFDYRPSGGGWGSDTPVNDVSSSVITSGTRGPSLTVDQDGNAAVVWTDLRNGLQQIYFSYRLHGASWGANEPVSTAFGQNPDVGIDASANSYVVWALATPDWEIAFRKRNASGAWDPISQVSDAQNGFRDFSAIAVTPAGEAVVVWADNLITVLPDSYEIYSTYREADGTWSPNTLVTPDLTRRKLAPDVAMDGQGYAYAVWMEEIEGTSWDIFFSTTAPLGSGPIVDVAVPHELTLNEDGWYAQNPTEVRVSVSNTGSAIMVGDLEVSFSNPSRLLFEDNGTLLEPPAILRRALRLNPGQSLPIMWPMWIQPMSGQTILVTAKMFNDSNGEILGVDQETMIIPTARIHPVVVIPGLLCSMKNAFGQWTIDPILGTYNNLLEELQFAGYEVDQSLFTFPYDWRQHISKSGGELGIAIRSSMLPKASVSEYVDSSSVDLVGHSLGGLVSRAYVQGDSYTGDVHRLITLGTPHLGAPKAYLAAEGLEFDFFDDIVGDKGKILAEWLLRALARKKGYCTDLTKLCFTTKTDLYQYIKDKVPSIRELFPVDEYLRDDPGGYLVAADNLNSIYPFGHQINEFLTSLNENIVVLINRLGGNNVISVVGDRYENERPLEDTDKLYKVVGRNLLDDIYGIWQNGKVLKGRDFRPLGRGDKTVPTASADLSFIDTRLVPRYYLSADNTSIIEHGHLPTQLQQSIVELLTKTRPFFNAGFVDPGINLHEAALGFIILSPVEIQITDPLGRRVGLDFNTGEELSEIPGTLFSRSIEVNEPDFIFIPDPLEGEYTIKLLGVEEGNYMVLVQALSDAGILTFAEFTGTTSPGDIHEHTATYNRASLPTAPLSIQWDSPLNDPDKPPRVSRNATLPIKFTIRDAEGRFAEDESVQVWVVDPSNPSSAIAFLSMENPGLHGKSDVIRIDADKQHYIVNLHLRDYNFKSGKTYLIGVSEFGHELDANVIFIVGD